MSAAYKAALSDRSVRPQRNENRCEPQEHNGPESTANNVAQSAYGGNTPVLLQLNGLSQLNGWIMRGSLFFRASKDRSHADSNQDSKIELTFYRRIPLLLLQSAAGAGKYDYSQSHS